MVRVSEVTKWLKGFADTGTGHDQPNKDGVVSWGTQCWDVPAGVSAKYFRKHMWGNAIDLLDVAKALGYKVELNEVGNVNSKPKEGALFVQRVSSHKYGHTGYVLWSDGYTMKTIEQNVDGWADRNRDGINDQLQVGGPARYVTRDFEGVIGWFYPPYDDKESTENTNILTLDKLRKAIVKVGALNIRTAPSTSAEIVGVYSEGETFLYTDYCYSEEKEWLSYIGQTSGNRVYICSADLKSGEVYVDWEYEKGA